jgi:hypothetical protein
MKPEIGIPLRKTVFDKNIVADLPADPIAVVVDRLDISDSDPFAILHEDATAIIAIEVGIIRTVPFDLKVLDFNISHFFSAEDREEDFGDRVMVCPKVLFQGSIQEKSISIAPDESAFDYRFSVVVGGLREEGDTHSRFEAFGIGKGDIGLVPVRVDGERALQEVILDEHRIGSGPLYPNARTEFECILEAIDSRENFQNPPTGGGKVVQAGLEDRDCGPFEIPARASCEGRFRIHRIFLSIPLLRPPWNHICDSAMSEPGT